ncbi:DUF1697 domain-containing protein [Nocardioides sambongensis]|uniref:DUF1697 domain-containing protein n=1 Tax=Nocardioides sambongensis TaxID=2589074 RepID=UPI00112E4FCC|nr:DUF1697 domain-containing protein [Nocardioides sambongensis]
MATQLAFLRAINLGGRRTFGKDRIIAATESIGFDGVATYINTGNVRFDTRMRSRARIERALEAAYLEHAGFEVPTIVFTAAEVAAIRDEADRLDHDRRHYVSLLKEEPSAQAVAALQAAVADAGITDERLHVSGRAVHLLLGENYHQSRLDNAFLERHLGVATNRNLTVIREVAARWCG